MAPFQQVEILGTEGRIELAEVPFNAPNDRPCALNLQHGDDAQRIEFDPCDQYTIQGDLFSQSILDDRPAPTPLDDAVRNMEVIEAIVASGRSNQWVEFGVRRPFSINSHSEDKNHAAFTSGGNCGLLDLRHCARGDSKTLVYQIEPLETRAQPPDVADVLPAVKRRIDALGEKNVEVKPDGKDRLSIEFSQPDDKTIDRVKKSLSQRGHLEFRDSREQERHTSYRGD